MELPVLELWVQHTSVTEPLTVTGWMSRASDPLTAWQQLYLLVQAGELVLHDEGGILYVGDLDELRRQMHAWRLSNTAAQLRQLLPVAVTWQADPFVLPPDDAQPRGLAH